jgi:hypothetical protein
MVNNLYYQIRGSFLSLSKRVVFSCKNIPDHDYIPNFVKFDNLEMVFWEIMLRC